MTELRLATSAIHADDALSDVPDVAPPIRVSTTYQYEENFTDDGRPVYSRLGQVNVTRVEAVLSELLEGKAVAYANGLASFQAAVTAINPKRVFVSGGYHGIHGILHILKRNHNLEILELSEAIGKAGTGDMVHVETALNPYGTVRDLTVYKPAIDRGAKLTVDATFMPPPLFKPFDFGAYLVMHSATKYFAGHSDTLAGVLATRDETLYKLLLEDRIYLGTVIGSLESWLLLRSLRTFSIRIKTQAENAAKIVKFLESYRQAHPDTLTKVYHASLQPDKFVASQYPKGGPMSFSIELKNEKLAKSFPGKLKLFHHCTSLGGVESTLEWRRLSDEHAPVTLLRLSIGIEDSDDLIADIEQGLNALHLEKISIH